MEPFRDIRVVPEEFIETDEEHVVVTVHVSGKGRSSGLPIDTRFTHLLTIRDGKVAQIRAFLKKEEALQASRPGK